MPILTTGAGKFAAASVGGGSAAYTNFIARGTSLTGSYPGYYQTLLDGLTTDGFFDGSGNTTYFDALYILATQNVTAAVLNLVSSSFPLTASGSPAFTANQGVNPPATTDYYDTGFNATTAGSPKYTQNLAHYSVWKYTNTTESVPTMGVSAVQHLITYTDGKLYPRINDPGAGGVTTGGNTGLFIGDRTSSGNIDTYRNGSSLGSVSSTSTTMTNGSCLVCKTLADPACVGTTVSAISIGGTLGSTKAGQFYTRMRAFMTSVGVP